MGFWSRFLGKTEPVIDEQPEVQEMIEVPVVQCDCKARQEEYLLSVDKMQKEINRLEGDKKILTKDVAGVRAKLEKAKLDEKIKLEDIAHMQKMLDESNQLEVERASFEAEKKIRKEVDDIKDEYKKKLEQDLIERQKELQGMYVKIMAALPNVNVRLKGDV